MLIRPISISFTEPLGKNPLLPHAEAGEYPFYHVSRYLAARYLAKGIERGAYVRRGKVGAHCGVRGFKGGLRLRKGVYVAGGWGRKDGCEGRRGEFGGGGLL